MRTNHPARQSHVRVLLREYSRDPIANPARTLGTGRKLEPLERGVFSSGIPCSNLYVFGVDPLSCPWVPVGEYSLGRDSVWGKAPSVDGFGRRSGQMVDTNCVEARLALAGEQVDPGLCLQVLRSGVIKAKGYIPWPIRLWPRSGGVLLGW